MSQMKILVVGELNIDLILNDIQGFPKLGEEIIADKMSLVMGSSSAILACNIATLGCIVAFAGVVGSDFFGKFILQELENREIDTSLVRTSNRSKTGATVVLNYAQERANVTHCGAMDELKVSDIPPDKMTAFDHLHFSSYFLQKGIQKDICELFRCAKEKGLTTSLDLQWDPQNKWNFPYKDCLPFVDIFLPNELEILSLSGESNLDSALNKIKEFANTIIVKQSTKGSLAFSNEERIHSEAFLHDSFVDAIGAGDSFNAGFLFKYMNGFSLRECLEFGNLSGAVNTTSAGGISAFESNYLFHKTAKELFNYKM